MSLPLSREIYRELRRTQCTGTLYIRLFASEMTDRAGRGGTLLLEANGDVPLDGVAFSRLD